MFALGFYYLNGWSMASPIGVTMDRPEWPPHPDRIFMSLAAAYFETGENPDEEAALRWIESLPPPAISASDATWRSTVTSYVPVNDVQVKKKLSASGDLVKLRSEGLVVLPEYRTRRSRSFPVAIPHHPKIYLVWPEVELGVHRAALERLTSKVTHVGHSASFVQAWVDKNYDTAVTWEPKERGIARHRLRVPISGRLDQLVRNYSHEGRRPQTGSWHGYDRPRKPEPIQEPGSVFDPDLIILTIRDKRIALPTTLGLTQAMRNVMMAACPKQPPPEWFSGHRLGGLPSTKPHLAVLPLPFVGNNHADGRVMGLALALPRNLNERHAGHCLEAFLHEPNSGLPRSHRLFDGRWFECTIEIETREQPPQNLTPLTWTRPSRVWASVTPVVLNRHFKGKSKWSNAAVSIKDACQHIGLPRPVEVLLHPTSLVQGVPLAQTFPQMVRKSDGGRMSHSHALIIFEEPVRGPVIVGAGRYRGYGLCRPMDHKNIAND